MKFFDRESELSGLERLYDAVSRGQFHFVVVSGRRGVGKTRLIYEFVKRVNARFVYFFVEKKEIGSLLLDFVSRLKDSLKLDVVVPRDFDNFLKLLRDLSSEESIVVIFDEFQNFRHMGGDIFFKFQEFVDFMKFGDGFKLMFIVIGSIVGMMKDIFEGKHSPLYGRKTSEFFLKPFEYWEVRKLLDEFGVRDEIGKLSIFSVFGGMPRYYDQMDRIGLSFSIENVINLFTNKVYSLWKAPRDELIEEFKDAHPAFFSILEAIAKGKVKANDIANYTSIPEKSIYKYLNELINYFELIEKRVPAVAPKNYRGAIYVIRDPFYRFWFRYIFPNQDLIELEEGQELTRMILNDLSNHISFVFEEIVRRTILKLSGKEIKGTKIPHFNKIGSWWDRKGNEIDVVGYKDKKILLVGEVKWRERLYDSKDLEKMLLKIDFLKAKNPTLVIVSKKGFTRGVKSFIEGEKRGLVLSLNDLIDIWNSFVK